MFDGGAETSEAPSMTEQRRIMHAKAERPSASAPLMPEAATGHGLPVLPLPLAVGLLMPFMAGLDLLGRRKFVILKEPGQVLDLLAREPDPLTSPAAVTALHLLGPDVRAAVDALLGRMPTRQANLDGPTAELSGEAHVLHAPGERRKALVVIGRLTEEKVVGGHRLGLCV